MPEPVTVTIRGRFWEQSDPILDQARTQVERELAEMGESRLHQMLRPRPAGVYLAVSQAKKGKASTGNYRRHVHALIRGAMHVITDSGVVYGPWLERGAAGTRFRGYAAFRRVGQWLQRQAPRVANKYINRLARQMNGA